MRMMTLAALLALVVATTAQPARADEGLWTLDNFPSSTLEHAYGARITQAWLDHIRLSTLRLTNCTGSFVSGDGLILTNHHCIESCLAQVSTKEESLIDRGFSAAKRGDERRCSTQLADVLVNMENVTAQVAKSVVGRSDTAANEARKKTLTVLEQACEQASAHAKSGPLKCQAVTLYDGGEYFLYKYKRYEDIRVVFAPESDIAAFGGDPDNFQFPRWSLDFSVLRAYEHGKPAQTPDHLQISFAGPHVNQLVFVAGHPGSTQRLETRAQLTFERDVVLPSSLLRAAELRGRYIQFGSVTPSNEQLVEAPLNSLENALKVRRKHLDALHDDAMMARKTEDETALRAKAHLEGPDPWSQIEATLERERALYHPHIFFENAVGFNSILFRYARLLLRGADERTKPNTLRLREFTDTFLPRIEQQIEARVPIYSEVEQLTLAFSLQRMREWLGPDHPIVRRLLMKDSPDTLATRLIAETKLDDAAVRKQLWDGGKTAVDASRDPMIELARSLDLESRAIRKQYEDEIEAPIAAASEHIAAARFKVYGTAVYPDATFTLRLSYGTVQGWRENGLPIDPVTYLARAFERATGVSPFKIPDSWMKVKDQLDMQTPFCISTGSDIVGGNSGSPLIDVDGRIVGLMFDGNIHSISGNYWFDPTKNRAIAVHPAIIHEALSKVYKANALLTELGDAP